MVIQEVIKSRVKAKRDLGKNNKDNTRLKKRGDKCIKGDIERRHHKVSKIRGEKHIKGRHVAPHFVYKKRLTS